MFVKIMGVVLILTASCGIGFRMSDNFLKRVEELKTLKKILFMLRGEIKYNNSTMAEAFETISGRVDNHYKEFFLEGAKALNDLSGQTFITIWKQMIDTNLKDSKLNKKDLERFKGLGENLGYLDKEMQLSNIDLYLEHLEIEIDEGNKNTSTNSRLYKCLGVMGGVLVTLIII